MRLTRHLPGFPGSRHDVARYPSAPYARTLLRGWKRETNSASVAAAGTRMTRAAASWKTGTGMTLPKARTLRQSRCNEAFPNGRLSGPKSRHATSRDGSFGKQDFRTPGRLRSARSLPSRAKHHAGGILTNTVVAPSASPASSISRAMAPDVRHRPQALSAGPCASRLRAPD